MATRDDSSGPVRLDQALVLRGLVDSRAQARAAIDAGKVFVNGRKVSKPALKIAASDELVAQAAQPYVSRGGLKLAHGLAAFNLSATGKVCLDVGASTGGFTDVLLQSGAARVFAVDVGREQFHASLRSDPRVEVLEETDARTLTTAQITSAPGLVVCDASFIGLEKLLGQPLSLAAPGADLIALFKPQFQVGPGKVGKGGIVKDFAATDLALSDFTAWLAGIGWSVMALDDSPIRGGDGNREILVHAKRSDV